MYAREELPVKTGLYWTKEYTNGAVMMVPHESVLSEEAIAHFSAEAEEKIVASNQARLVCYRNVKGDFSTRMKVSPIAATHHKSKSFR